MMIASLNKFSLILHTSEEAGSDPRAHDKRIRYRHAPGTEKYLVDVLHGHTAYATPAREETREQVGQVRRRVDVYRSESDARRGWGDELGGFKRTELDGERRLSVTKDTENEGKRPSRQACVRVLFRPSCPPRSIPSVGCA